MASRDRYAIVTGGASGLGRAISLELAKEGWTICIADINTELAEDAKKAVEAAGGKAIVEQIDVTSLEAWEGLSERIRAIWPQLDLLVNNAGIAGAGRIGEFPIEDWHRIVDINLWNAVYGSHVFVDWLKANPNGAHIINTASMAGIACPPGMGAYNVTKASVIALSETLWCELHSAGVGVTVLCPEFFPTRLLDNPLIPDPEALKWARRRFETSPFTAEDVARAAIDAMKRKKLYVVYPSSARTRWYIKRLNPMYFLKKVTAILERGIKPNKSASAKSSEKVGAS